MGESKTPYSYGYKKPPKHAQYKPGVSGNKKGRPKGAKSFRDILRKELVSPVSITIKGKLKKVPLIQALIKTMLVDALNGKERSRRLVVDLIHAYERQGAAVDGPPKQLSEKDVALLTRFFRREGERLGLTKPNTMEE